MTILNYQTVSISLVLWVISIMVLLSQCRLKAISLIDIVFGLLLFFLTSFAYFVGFVYEVNILLVSLLILAFGNEIDRNVVIITRTHDPVVEILRC